MGEHGEESYKAETFWCLLKTTEHPSPLPQGLTALTLPFQNRWFYFIILLGCKLPSYAADFLQPRLGNDFILVNLWVTAEDGAEELGGGDYSPSYLLPA